MGEQPIKDLAEFLLSCQRAGVKGPLSIINTDNVPSNGSKIAALLRDEALLEEVLRGAGHNEKQGGSNCVMQSCSCDAMN